jgi:hypothetical protein
VTSEGAQTVGRPLGRHAGQAHVSGSALPATMAPMVSRRTSFDAATVEAGKRLSFVSWTQVASCSR